MPVNFLYYGVARETVDMVIAQLLEVAAGMVVRTRDGGSLPCRLLALDSQADFAAFRGRDGCS